MLCDCKKCRQNSNIYSGYQVHVSQVLNNQNNFPCKKCGNHPRLHLTLANELRFTVGKQLIIALELLTPHPPCFLLHCMPGSCYFIFLTCLHIAVYSCVPLQHNISLRPSNPLFMPFRNKAQQPSFYTILKSDVLEIPDLLKNS